jgi:hypothetical protein
MQSIREIGLQIKGWLEKNAGEWGIPVIVALVGLGSFSLGRFSAFEDARPAVALSQATVSTSTAPIRMGGYVVALDTGTVYYLPWCAGAQKMALSRQRWFKTEAEARKAGYKAAKGCKGIGGQ